MELLPYSPNHRNAVEKRLSDEANKPEIHFETRYGLDIAVYYLRKLGQVSMALGKDQALREFIIPNDKVLDAIAHPEIYATDAGMPRQITRPYQEA